MGLGKTAYVTVMRGAGRLAKTSGLSAKLESGAERSRAARWVRSLFAIYNIDEMVKLDLPWWTFDAIEEVDAFLKNRPNARVFEYGSGASTIWLARRAASVISIEHDPSWFPIVKEKLTGRFPNVDLRLVPADATAHGDAQYVSVKPGWKGRSFHDYVHAIDAESGSFDVIVVDGRARVACLAHAASRLAPDGLLVFDNTHRPAYRQAIAASPLRAKRTRGLTACLPYPDETTLMRHG